MSEHSHVSIGSGPLDALVAKAKLSQDDLKALQSHIDELEVAVTQEQHHEHHDESVDEPKPSPKPSPAPKPAHF